MKSGNAAYWQTHCWAKRDPQNVHSAACAERATWQGPQTSPDRLTRLWRACDRHARPDDSPLPTNEDMMAPTPGPWSVHANTLEIRAGDDAVADCVPEHGTSTWETMEANARLIAAAPELLAAAAGLLHKISTMTTEEFSRGEERPERERLRAEIAKATGG